MENKRAVGSRYEEETAAFLQKNGYRILEKNFRDRRGEIDLIAKDGRTLVFVEVKYRKNARNGYPEEAVDTRKHTKTGFRNIPPCGLMWWQCWTGSSS